LTRQGRKYYEMFPQKSRYRLPFGLLSARSAGSASEGAVNEGRICSSPKRRGAEDSDVPPAEVHKSPAL
jgi:hypothetical protein